MLKNILVLERIKAVAPNIDRVRQNFLEYFTQSHDLSSFLELREEYFSRKTQESYSKLLLILLVCLVEVLS